MKSAFISIGFVVAVCIGMAGTSCLHFKVQTGCKLEQSGRDAAIIKEMQKAHKSVIVRTDSFEMCEIATILANLPQKGVLVTVEIPEETAKRPREDAFRQLMPKLNVAWKIGCEPSEAYKGTLIIIDGETMIYSGSPLNYAPPKSTRPYVIGKLQG